MRTPNWTSAPIGRAIGVAGPRVDERRVLVEHIVDVEREGEILEKPFAADVIGEEEIDDIEGVDAGLVRHVLHLVACRMIPGRIGAEAADRCADRRRQVEAARVRGQVVDRGLPSDGGDLAVQDIGARDIGVYRPEAGLGQVGSAEIEPVLVDRPDILDPRVIQKIRREKRIGVEGGDRRCARDRKRVGDRVDLGLGGIEGQEAGVGRREEDRRVRREGDRDLVLERDIIDRSR